VPAPQEKAWQDGYAVGKKGKPETLNPFKKGMLLTAWQEGWRNGAKTRDGDKA
jgi:ribosome modulation factor